MGEEGLARLVLLMQAANDAFTYVVRKVSVFPLAPTLMANAAISPCFPFALEDLRANPAVSPFPI